MRLPTGFSFGTRPATPDIEPHTEYVQVQRPLRRVLAFARRSIDDVVNDPMAKREVLGYYKLYRQIERGVETSDLERQWRQPAKLAK